MKNCLHQAPKRKNPAQWLDFSHGLYRTRTCNLLDVNEALCQLS